MEAIYDGPFFVLSFADAPPFPWERPPSLYDAAYGESQTCQECLGDVFSSKQI